MKISQINILTRKLKRAAEIWQAKGLTGIKFHLAELRLRRRDRIAYQKWVRADALTENDRQAIRRKIENFSLKPTISIVLPVYNVEEKWLRLCLESVLKQLYPYWELCIADDCSPAPHIRRVLAEYAAKDKRIKVVFRGQNGHISAASNSALELATGEFCALLDHDDELAEYALYFVAAEINKFPDASMIYSDEDMINENGDRYDPKFKPDWSPDLFYSLNLITHLSVYRTSILHQINGFQTGVEGSQDYDLALRVIEQIPAAQIRHIPRILYHWRAIPGSVALDSNQKDYAHEAARRAIRQHLARRGVAATVTRGYEQLHRVRYSIPANAPLVTIISRAAADLTVTKNFAKTVLNQTNYPNFEIFLVVNEKQSPQLIRFAKELEDQRLFVKTTELSSESGILNFAAQQVSGEVLCFLDSNLNILTTNWLDEMVSHALRPQIGAVGAKLYNLDSSVQHTGYIIGIKNLFGAAHSNLPPESAGNFVRAQVTQNASAVSAACLAVRRKLFAEVNGFDAENLPNKFYDADFCLRLIEKGYRIVWTPYAELSWRIKVNDSLKETEGKFHSEANYFRARWKKVILRDPYYNPNFSLDDETFALGFPPPDLLA